MPETFSVSFESPQSGWMSLRLRAGGRQFLAVVSYTPYDSLRDLTGGLAALLEEGRPVTVRWNAEPEEFDFVFAARGGAGVLRVVRYPDHGRRVPEAEEVFACGVGLREMCRRFRDELLTLRERGATDDFERNWRRPFPVDELRRLCAALELPAQSRRRKDG